MRNKTLELIQAEGPKSHTKEGYDAWYNRILSMTNNIAIKGELEEDLEEAETVGDWDPINRVWISGRHEKQVNLQEER